MYSLLNNPVVNWSDKLVKLVLSSGYPVLISDFINSVKKAVGLFTQFILFFYSTVILRKNKELTDITSALSTLYTELTITTHLNNKRRSSCS